MYLMMQDIPIMKIDLDKNIYEVLREDLMPIRLKDFYKPVQGTVNEQVKEYTQYNLKFQEYMASRVLSLSRKNAKKILNAYHFSQMQDNYTKATIAVACKAISMTDDYWINDDKLSFKWENINLRENSLNQVITQIALTGSSLTATGELNTPEISTQGAYAKAWIRHKDGVYLYKTGNGENEEKIEVCVSRILDCFNVEHVKYSESVFENYNVCVCKNMCDDNKSIVPALDYYSYCTRTDKNFLSEALKIDAESIYKMCVVDYLISNSDRHGMNWGFYRNNRTGEMMSAHPLFDHNNAFDESLMKNPDEFRSQIFENKSLHEAALYSMNRCHLQCVDKVTKDMFLNEQQYDTFMKRACELGLYKEKDKRLFSFSKERYEPIIIKDKSDFKDELRTFVKQNIQIEQEKEIEH